jgi:hypothetical protein
MSDILRLLVIILFLTVGLTACFLTMRVLFAARVAKTKTIVQNMPARSFGIGLVNFSFFFVIALVLLTISDKIENGFLKGVVLLPALLLLAFITIMLAFGLAGMAGHVGEGILPDLPEWKQTAWGTVCLCLACALPFAGWFLLFPYIGFVGIGAFILGIFQREVRI